MKREICFEGVCTSGKTTLGRLMEDRSTRYFSEYSQLDVDVARRNEMRFPHQTKELAEASFRSFLVLDVYRSQMIVSTDVERAVTDRGLVGMLAFEYSLIRNNLKNVFCVSAELVENHMRNSRCNIPAAWVHVRFNDLGVFDKRVAGRVFGLPYLLQRDTVLLLQEYYDEFFMSIGERGQVVVAEGDLMSNKQRVSQFMEARFDCCQMERDELIGIIRRINGKLQKR